MEHKTNGHTATQHKWIDAICIVKFDHELGLVVEHTIPENAFSATDLSAVAMVSFPESNCVEKDEPQAFFFRSRLNSGKVPIKGENPVNRKFVYGYSYYYQRKDPTNPRGYFQKAFVILTKYYFCTFYRSLATIMGRAYFKSEDKEFLQVVHGAKKYSNYIKVFSSGLQRCLAKNIPSALSNKLCRYSFEFVS